MVSFFAIDITFLTLFSLWVTFFLYRRRDKLDREGIMFLYRTQLGVKFIEKFSKKNKKILNGIVPLVIGVGYVLMGIMVWLLYKTVEVYLLVPEIKEIISAPPIMPLIPYFPTLFGLESIFPPLYFTYFILALLIVAVVHEFSHGIFMRTFGVKIKSTGFAFLGPILGAFVEEERKGFQKKKTKEQLAVLAAGVFANIVFGFIFFGLLALFFSLAYTPIAPTIPVGYNINIYSATDNINEAFVTDLNDSEVNLVMQRNETITSRGKVLTSYLHNDSGLMGILATIKTIDGAEILSGDDVRAALEGKLPGDVVNIDMLVDEEINNYDFVLRQHSNEDRAILGIGSNFDVEMGLKEKVLSFFILKKPFWSYEPKFETADFWYNLLWWIMLINFMVGLFNMLPLGILDGGRFFYLTVLSITRSKKVAEMSYKLAGLLILFIFILMMVLWAI